LEELIPIVYIPRKPHPNGFLLYLIVSFIHHPHKQNSVIPVIIDIIPHLQVGDVCASKAVQDTMNR
jgi:hypothetical protein